MQDAEEGEWDNASNVAPDAYESATGEDFPTDDAHLSGDPSGEAWMTTTRTRSCSVTPHSPRGSADAS